MSKKKLKLLDMDSLKGIERFRVVRSIANMKQYPCYLFDDEMLFQLSSQHTLDAKESSIVLACLENLAENLQAYYDSKPVLGLKE